MHVQYLLKQLRLNVLSAAERQELLKLLQQLGSNELTGLITELMEDTANAAGSAVPGPEMILILDRILSQDKIINADNKIHPFRRRPYQLCWFWAAASVMLLISVAVYFHSLF